jgi:hypothetical protein
MGRDQIVLERATADYKNEEDDEDESPARSAFSAILISASVSCRLVGVRLSGRFSVSKPKILELSESRRTDDIEAP